MTGWGVMLALGLGFAPPDAGADAPSEETAAEEAPAEDAPAGDAPAEETPAEETPTEETPEADAPTDGEPAPTEADPAEGGGDDATAETEGDADAEPATSEPAEPEPEPEAEPPPEGAIPGLPAGWTIQPAERDGPPFYDEEDMAKLRERYELPPEMPPPERRARFRCLVADQTCGITVELNATSAYAFRMQQGDVSVVGDVSRWSSGRVQYDAWLNIPTAVEVLGRSKYTRLTLGPKGGVITSDGRDIWGNFGVAGRYFFTRGAWSPTLEFSSALAFRLFGAGNCVNDSSQTCPVSQRSPLGVAGDVGIGVGGWGAVIVGGQYDSPLAREDLPEQFRISSSGMVYVGFRGNFVWGAPVGAAVATQVMVQRRVARP